MEFVFFIIWLIVCYLYWQHIQLKNRRHEQLLKDFVNWIVPCKIEEREGCFFIYNGLTNQFLAQCKKADDLEGLLALDKMYMNWECSKTIYDDIKDREENCTPLKST